MPGYEEQLAAYRQQLRDASAPAASYSPGLVDTASLAYNTMSDDIAKLASMVKFNPSTPYMSDVAPSAPYIMPQTMAAIGGVAGISSPSISMNTETYRKASRAYLADMAGKAAGGGTLTAGTAAAAVGGGLAFDAVAALGAGAVGYTGGSAAAMMAGAAAGLETGAIIGAGSAGTSMVGATIGGAVGAAAGLLAPIAAPALAGAALFSTVADTYSQYSAKSDVADYLQNTSWRYTGRKGFNRRERSDIASDIVSSGATDRDFNVDDVQGILQSGSELGMFNGTKDVDDFKRKFKDLKEGLKEVMKTMMVSRDEGMQLMAEAKQVGHHTGASAANYARTTTAMGIEAGYSAREMHEVGMRGAAMFRGTGLGTAVGAEMAQSNLMAVMQMQRGGTISPNVIQQQGGAVAAAQKISGIQGMLMNTSYGKAAAALMVDNDGGKFDEDAYNRIASGERLSDVLADKRPDYRRINAVNVSDALTSMGADRMGILAGNVIGTQASVIMESNPEMKFRDAFFKVAQDNNIDVGSQKMLYQKFMSAPDVLRDKAGALRDQLDLSVEDEYNRRHSFSETIGLSSAYRGFRRGTGALSDAVTGVGDTAAEAIESVEGTAAGVWRKVRGMKLVTKTPIDSSLVMLSARREAANKAAGKETVGSSIDQIRVISDDAADDLSVLAHASGAGDVKQPLGTLSSKGLKEAMKRGDYSTIDEADAEIFNSGRVVSGKLVSLARAQAEMFRSADSQKYSGDFAKTDDGKRANKLAAALSSEKYGDRTIGEILADKDSSKEDLINVRNFAFERANAADIDRGAFASALMKVSGASDESRSKLKGSVSADIEVTAESKEKFKEGADKDMSTLMDVLEDKSGEEITDSGSWLGEWRRKSNRDSGMTSGLKKFFKGGGLKATESLLKDLDEGTYNPEEYQSKLAKELQDEGMDKDDAMKAAKKWTLSLQKTNAAMGGREKTMAMIEKNMGNLSKEAHVESFENIKKGLASSFIGDSVTLDKVNEAKTMRDITKAMADSDSAKGFSGKAFSARSRIKDIMALDEEVTTKDGKKKKPTPWDDKAKDELWDELSDLGHSEETIDAAMRGAKTRKEVLLSVADTVTADVFSPDKKTTREVSASASDRAEKAEMKQQSDINMKTLKSLEVINVALQHTKNKLVELSDK